MVEDEKLCFVIAPIGEPGSLIRKHSDQVFKHIIEPAARLLGYVATRAHEIPEPGTITSQVIQRLLDSPLVIADLTTRNPNVFYELAIRHACRKPLVQLIDVNEPIPFDVATARTIKFTLADPDSVASARDELAQHIKAVEKDPSLVDNPISTAIDLGALRSSGKSSDAQLAAILETLSRLQADVASLTSRAIGEPIDRFITKLKLGHTTPLNPADAFRLAESNLEKALAAHRAQPGPVTAGAVQQAAQDVLTTVQQVWTRPSPEYHAVFNRVLGVLESVRPTLGDQL
jgi:hypothetical protein